MYAKTEVGNMGLKLQEAREHICPFYLFAAVFLGERDDTTNTDFLHRFYKLLHTAAIKSVQLSTAPQKLILFSASGHLCAPAVWNVAGVFSG